MTPSDMLRELPSVQEVLTRLKTRLADFPDSLVIAEARTTIALARSALLRGETPYALSSIDDQTLQALQRLIQLSLVPVINATGVVLHTNLGRAPLGVCRPLPGYSNLEYDLATGRRGKRDSHLQPLLKALLGKPGVAVNNGAAAAFLVANELASGYEVIVSRGELIEIGDGFRIPEILQRAGAVIREVGTTNRTRVGDYSAAIGERTRLIMRVHPSNFRMSGFTARPSLSEIVGLGLERGIPVYEDLGSGNMVDLRSHGVDEPLVGDSLRQGVNLVSFSGDKLLGGPQAGIIAGDSSLIDRIRRNPLFRALRLDKLIYQILQATLRDLLMNHGRGIPALCMIRITAEEIRQRACQLFPGAELIPGESVIGGGATPQQNIPTTLVVVACRNPVEAERQLRSTAPHVIARIHKDRLVLDLRTVFPGEEPALRDAVLQIA